jgi:signal transduction histidine kinase
MRRFRQISPLIAFMLVLLITTSITLFGVKTLRDRDAADAWVTRTNTIINQIDHMYIGLVNMETGLRGYLLAGDNQFLDPYLAGKTQYDDAIRNLLVLTQGNSMLLTHLQKVQALQSQWEKEWALRGIQLRQDVNTGKTPNAAIIDYVSSQEGKQIMDQIRQEMMTIEGIENDLLAHRIAVEYSANQRAYWVMLSGILLSVILGLATGIFLRRSTARSHEFIEIQKLLLEEREKERMEVARDLHDGPVQDLLATTYTLQSLHGDELPPEAASGLDEIQSTIQKVISDLRAYAMELRSPVLVQFGLEKAIQSHLELFRHKYPQVQIRFDAKQKGDLLPIDCRNALFRIFQEAMNNVVRHSQATEVAISFNKLDNLAVLEMHDNGVGFDPPNDWLSLARHGHLGLVGIRERADAIGGEVEIQSHPGRGTNLRVIVPL